MDKTSDTIASPGRRAAAWGVHLLTASSAVWGLLATLALIRGEWIAMFWWIGLTIFIDGIDGALARVVRVKQALPHFDGALLDNIVDYLTYVFIPAVFLYQAGLLPASVALGGAAAVVLSSAYQFSQSEAKTADNFFKGFPSYWNLVAFYLFVMNWGAWANFFVVSLCAVLVFVPFKYAYPSRMTRYRTLTLALAALWAAAVVAMLALYPDVPGWLAWGSLLFVAYYVGVSILLAAQRRRRD